MRRIGRGGQSTVSNYNSECVVLHVTIDSNLPFIFGVRPRLLAG